MASVVVERSFEAPVDFEDVQTRERAVAWCLELHGVRFVRTYFSADRRHMVCLYEAPDAEAVRKTQDTGKLPYDRIWPAIDIPGPPGEAAGRFETVIVQRDWTPPVREDQLDDLLRRREDCMRRLRSALTMSHLALNGAHQICVFEAPDAEAVRRANRDSGLDVLRVWKASIHEPTSG